MSSELSVEKTSVLKVDSLLEKLSGCLNGEAEVEREDVPIDIGVVDLRPLLEESGTSEAAAARLATGRQISDSLQKYGVVVVRDPRVPSSKNELFLDLFEDYFARPTFEKLKDTRPKTGFQVGPTPERTEVPRSHCARIRTLDASHRPLSACPPEADPKWRYFWRLASEGRGSDGRLAAHSGATATQQPKDFTVLNMANVIPERMPEFQTVCNDWGGRLLNAGRTIARGLELGYDLEPGFLTSRMERAPHLLAPTATDLDKYGKKGTIVAGFHYDLNFLTVHGKSRFPGLYVWLRDGRRRRVVVPKGCLIAQSALQMQHLFGGRIFAGFHEVVVSDGTLAAARRQRAAGRPLWRVSSTVFTHIRSDVLLQPMAQFATAEAKRKYPPILAGDLVLRELRALKLMPSK